jgi:hypothetical protein
VSAQVGTAQAPLSQILLAQSVPTEHVSPSSQALQAGPPQSTSVSLLLITLSEQVSRQTEPEHDPPTQSVS